MQFDDNGNITMPDNGYLTHTILYDEKPGIQAVANKYPHHDPTVENGYIRRDYEYVRLGTLSLLAGIDLLTGEAIPLVSQPYKSCDFIKFLKILNAKYPEGDTIRLILDNHSAHTSKETCQFLKTLPEDRIVFVFTPTHTSWMNMIESFFSKMTKQMLKGIRVNSIQEAGRGVYHIENAGFFKTQVIVTRELDETAHLWLRSLTDNMNRLQAQQLIRRSKEMMSRPEAEYVEAVLQIAAKANRKIFEMLKEEDDTMYSALVELMQPEIDEAAKKAREEAWEEAWGEAFNIAEAKKTVEAVGNAINKLAMSREEACAFMDITPAQYEAYQQVIQTAKTRADKRH